MKASPDPTDSNISRVWLQQNSKRQVQSFVCSLMKATRSNRIILLSGHRGLSTAISEQKNAQEFQSTWQIKNINKKNKKCIQSDNQQLNLRLPISQRGNLLHYLTPPEILLWPINEWYGLPWFSECVLVKSLKTSYSKNGILKLVFHLTIFCFGCPTGTGPFLAVQLIKTNKKTTISYLG